MGIIPNIIQEAVLMLTLIYVNAYAKLNDWSKGVVITILLLFPAWLSAQISGYVKSVDGTPLPYASVSIAGSSAGTFTDTAGFYRLADFEVSSDEITLRASMLGYEAEKRRIRVGEGPSASIDFSLSEGGVALNEVVVSGTLKTTDKLDSPVPVEVYTEQFFRANPAPSVFESMQQVNGVRPQLNCNVCNTGDIHINGLEGPYTMVLIDGMPIVSGLATVYGLTGIPQSLIQRVEIVKGPAATLYGSEAVGGLINIITKHPDEAARFSVESMISGWGEVNTDVSLSANIGAKASTLFGVNYFNYSAPRDDNNDGFTDLTLQDRISVFNKWSVERSGGRELSFAGRYVYEDRWGGEMNWTPAFRGGDEIYGESIYTSRWEGFGTYDLPTEEAIRLQVSANGHSQNSYYGDVFYAADQYIGFGQLTWRPKGTGAHDILFGSALRYTFYDDNTPATASREDLTLNQPDRIWLPGAFVQDEIRLSPTQKVLLGLRYDYNSRHGSILSPRLNYQWKGAEDRSTLRLSVGNGYRVANVFTEDHAALTGARELVFASELAPERSWNANLNFVRKFFTSDYALITIDASAFYTHFSNRILPDYETNPNQIIYDNLNGRSVSRGISLNVNANFLNGLSMNVGATAQDVYVEEEGVRFRPILTEGFSGVWQVAYPFRNLGLKLDYTGNVYGPMRLPLLGELDPRPGESPWFSTQNIQVTKSFGDRWELYGGIKNLLDYTPPANSIARSFDPFDRGVAFGADGQALPTPDNPNALTFDPTYVFASNQGRRWFFGVRYNWR